MSSTIEDAVSTVRVPIASLAPEPFELTEQIHAVVQPTEGGYTATFFDANINTSGDTQEEAIRNLKSLICELYEDLEGESVETLGPQPLRQLEVLRTILK